MTNEIIYKGLKLTSGKCKYFQVKEGKSPRINEDVTLSTLTLTYTPGMTPKEISSSLGLELVGSGNVEMEPMSSPAKFAKTYITLNGLKLEKLTYDPHIINVVIVEDNESRVVQNYRQTAFIINKSDYNNPNFIKFLFYSGNLHYLRPIGPKIEGYELRNFPKLMIGNESINLESSSTAFYTLRKRYNDYLIRGIDYQDQFIKEIRRILDDYGIELVRLNKETTLTRTSYVTYQFNQTPIADRHPKRGDYYRNIMDRKQSIEFTFHTTDMVLYHDFKDKFINVMLLSNFTEFRTMDKAGKSWNAAAKWSSITEDFNHVYQPDDNSNFSFQCQFRCELYFYEVLDTRYEFLNEIQFLLDSEDVGGNNIIEENNTIK